MCHFPIVLHVKTKRYLRIDGERTSVALEGLYWGLLEQTAKRREATVEELVGHIIDESRDHLVEGVSMTSLIRVWCTGEAAGLCRELPKATVKRDEDGGTLDRTP